MSGLMPPGWSAHQAPDGRWYYAHSSGVTQWTPPAPQGGASAPAPPQGYGAGPHPQQPQYAQPKYQAPAPGGYPGSAPAPAAHHSYGGAAPQPGPTHHVSAAAAKYVYPQTVEFKLKEKAFSLSGDSFSIKRVTTGEPVFKVKGNALSFRDSKALFDLNGTPIYKMSESIVSLRGRMQITDAATKKPVLTLRKKGFIPMMGTSTIQAWRGASDEGAPYLECKGDFFRKDFDIKEVASGRVIASVKRKSFNLSNILLEKDTYIIRIEPGYDAAMLVFFVIAVDEQYRDDGERRGYGSLF